MAKLAKSIITVTDESAYGAGIYNTIPLYVFATESNKVLDSSSGAIAPGTTLANELLVMTSQKDVINTFGVPTFEEVNGTVMQGSELNEVGLLGLYSAMGSSALGYAVRADIDLAQLKASKKEPTTNPDNGKEWFDLNSSIFAVYKNNGGNSPIALQNWVRQDITIVEELPEAEMDEIVFLVDNNSKTGTFYQCVDGRQWYVIGSQDWRRSFAGDVKFSFDSHIYVPENQAQDSIWIQTTKVNAGTDLVKKTFNSTFNAWVSSSMNVFKSEEDTEKVVLIVDMIAAFCDENEAKLSFKKYTSDDSWIKASDLDITFDEPRNPAKDGTLWFNDDLTVDILVNNGSKWVDLNEMPGYSDAKIYVQADMPENPAEMSVWVDTNDTTYPAISRYFSGKWNPCDNTDKTTAMGVLFADARYKEPEIEKDPETGAIIEYKSNLDDDCPNANGYPKGMLLFNMGMSGNNVKKYNAEKEVWETASGNDIDGSGLFGAKAQRKMIVEALNGAVNSCEELRSSSYDFFFACCPGYPEVDEALSKLNNKEMFYIVSDTPKDLKPTPRAITDWASTRSPRSAYMTRQYPPMGMSSNVDGKMVAIPTSIVKMKNLLNLPTGQICAGTQYGVVSNINSTGYITEENEYAIVSVNEGLGETIVGQSMNPIMMRRNTGLLFWGENTENNGNTSLSDEHAILSLLRLKRELDEACTPFFFRKNTLATRNDFNYVLRTILNSYIANEEFYDYVLDTETPNTAETISRKELHANIAVEIVKGIEFIIIPIRVVNTGTLSEQSIVA